MEKTAIITGTKRIGRLIAERLLSRGYNLCVVYRRSKEGVKIIEEIAKGSGRKVLTLKADLSNPSTYEEVVERTYEEFGRIDAFVHLASPYYRTPMEKVSREDFYNHFIPIAEAFLFISKLAYKKMFQNEGNIKGRIVAFGDWAVEHTPYRNYTAYFISKGALHTAVKVLAKEFAPHVLVNCIALGPTLKAEELDDKAWERILRNTPLKKEVSLNDVVDITEFLLNAESITGEIIKLDSGKHLAGSGSGF